MPNFAVVLKEEIRRLARKEIRKAISLLRTDNAYLKRTVAALKRKSAQLERDNRMLIEAENKRMLKGALVPPEEAEKFMATARRIRALRKRLKLSQANFAKLLGVSSQTVYQWERKKGRIRLRDQARRAVVSARQIGAREAKRLLAAKQDSRGKKQPARARRKARRRKK